MEHCGAKVGRLRNHPGGGCGSLWRLCPQASLIQWGTSSQTNPAVRALGPPAEGRSGGSNTVFLTLGHPMQQRGGPWWREKPQEKGLGVRSWNLQVRVSGKVGAEGVWEGCPLHWLYPNLRTQNSGFLAPARVWGAEGTLSL